MSDFWVSSGHHLLDRSEHGRLAVTDEFLKAYLARPELVPPPEACIVERAIHDRLKRAPRDRIDAAELKLIADRDARENWRFFLSFRDLLVAHGTIQAAYLAIVRQQGVAIPPLFLNQLVHVVARSMLEGERDPFVLRAAELLYRPQRLTINDGVMLLADEELVDGVNVTDHGSPLVAVFGDARARELDVMNEQNATGYFPRSDGFDFVLDFRMGSRGRAAFARVVEMWVGHMTGVEVGVEPLETVEDQDWSWFVGLDAEATRIGNALWQGEEPADDGRSRIAALFRLTFKDKREMLEKVAGKPVYLILAVNQNRIMRVKPQNLLTGLPVRSMEHVS